MKILLAVDGSHYTQAAARYLARNLPQFSQPVDVHVLHVQPRLPYEGGARAVLGAEAIQRYEREESDVALAIAEHELRDVAGCTYARTSGDPAAMIEDYVARNAIDTVVMGSRGHGVFLGVLLGSVAARCIERLEVPILLVPRGALEVKDVATREAAAAT